MEQVRRMAHPVLCRRSDRKSMQFDSAMPVKSKGKQLDRNGPLESDSCTVESAGYSSDTATSGYCTSPAIKDVAGSCWSRTQCASSRQRCGDSSSEEDFFDMPIADQRSVGSCDEAEEVSVQLISNRNPRSDPERFNSWDNIRLHEDRSYVSETHFSSRQGDLTVGTELSTTSKHPRGPDIEISTRKNYVEYMKPDSGACKRGQEDLVESRRHCIPKLPSISCRPRQEGQRAGGFWNRGCLTFSKSVTKVWHKSVSADDLREMAGKIHDVNEMKALLDIINSNLKQLEIQRRSHPIYFTT